MLGDEWMETSSMDNQRLPHRPKDGTAPLGALLGGHLAMCRQVFGLDVLALADINGNSLASDDESARILSAYAPLLRKSPSLGGALQRALVSSDPELRGRRLHMRTCRLGGRIVFICVVALPGIVDQYTLSRIAASIAELINNHG